MTVNNDREFVMWYIQCASSSGMVTSKLIGKTNKHYDSLLSFSYHLKIKGIDCIRNFLFNFVVEGIWRHGMHYSWQFKSFFNSTTCVLHLYLQLTWFNNKLYNTLYFFFYFCKIFRQDWIRFRPWYSCTSLHFRNMS